MQALRYLRFSVSKSLFFLRKNETVKIQSRKLLRKSKNLYFLPKFHMKVYTSML